MRGISASLTMVCVLLCSCKPTAVWVRVSFAARLAGLCHYW